MENDYFGYTDKVCVITGAASGMGKSAAEILVNLGARVYALDRNPCEILGIEEFIEVDLADARSIDAAFGHIPSTIDNFFGVAGLSGAKTDYMTTFNVNYTANMYISERYLRRRMCVNGAITFVSSMAGIAWKEHIDECDWIFEQRDWEAVQRKMGELVGDDYPAAHAYLYSKRLINAYACKASIEYARQGVRVNSILPGSTDTGMKDEFARMSGGMENMIKYAGMAGRLARSSEISYPLVFLGSQMASFISGEELIVDYCDNAMKKLAIKQEVCGAPAF